MSADRPVRPAPVPGAVDQNPRDVAEGRRDGAKRPREVAKQIGPRARRAGARRAADRHYVAVVAAEARRLARQLRPSAPAGSPSTLRPQGSH